MKVKTQTKTAQYLAMEIGERGIDDIEAKDIAGGIVQELLRMVDVTPLTSAYVKSLYSRIKRNQPRARLDYETYLQAAAMFLGFQSWQRLMRTISNSDVIPHSFPIAASVPKANEGSIYIRGPLARLTRGILVTWVELKAVLYSCSSKDRHLAIDTLLLEMQMAVGITNVTDPRGDMLFAVFRDPEDIRGFIILGERYRKPEERTGEYLTVQVKVKTYAMTNRIESIGIPNGDRYSPFTIKQLVEKIRDLRSKATVGENK